MSRAAVIGAGTMGNGIAHVLAQHEWDVALVDSAPPALEQATATIRTNLDRQVKKGTLPAEAPAGILGRIHPGTDLEAVRDASLVVEAASENPAVKFALFEQLDRLAPPDAILASNTSSISITEIGARTKRPEQVVGMHFMNPVPVMQLVEVIRGLATSDATTAAVLDLSRRLGKTPVEVNDYPGFVANRILMPMINEAVYCVMEGVGTPEAIDTVMKLGMNHPMGPLTLADFIGLDTCVAILEVMHRGLGDPKYRPCPLLKKYVAAGWLGRASSRRCWARSPSSRATRPDSSRTASSCR
ncbi:MAG: 3-hydroxyacyl-CoA dehydrogenase family protein [Gemmatimonadales bacterium]